MHSMTMSEKFWLAVRIVLLLAWTYLCYHTWPSLLEGHGEDIITGKQFLAICTIAITVFIGGFQLFIIDWDSLIERFNNWLDSLENIDDED